MLFFILSICIVCIIFICSIFFIFNQMEKYIRNKFDMNTLIHTKMTKRINDLETDLNLIKFNMENLINDNEILKNKIDTIKTQNIQNRSIKKKYN